MLILLPPSEGKATPSRGKPLALADLSLPVLTDPRADLLQALVELCRDQPEEAARVLGLGPTQFDLVARNAALETAPTARADAVYTGVLYDALDVATLSAAARRRSTRWLAVASALFGIVRPQDRIPAYRLSGDTTLPSLGSVQAFWRRHLGPAAVAAAGSGLVIDLRSSMYAAFWKPEPPISARVTTVRVLHEHQGTRKVVSHFNKATKGRIVRALLEDGSSPSTPAQLAELLGDLGWTVEPAAATKTGQRLDVIVTDL